MAPPPPSPGPPTRTPLWGQLRAIFSVLSGLSIYTAGLLGILVIQATGKYLAMGLQLHSGNTEPTPPNLPWPLPLTLLLGLLPIPLWTFRQWSLGMVASIPFALLPWWQLYRMFLAAGS